MGFLKNLSFTLFLFWVFGLFFLGAVMGADYTNMVFRGCAQEQFPDPIPVYKQNSESLFSNLVSQSSQKTFSTFTAGQDQTAITGVYQCRGDLSLDQCSTCVSKIPKMIEKFCGNSVAGRVQLSGCYLRYEIAGFMQIPGTEFLYRVCGSTQGTGDFVNKTETAFGIAENGVKSGSALFYTGEYQSVYVLAQCEGNLSSSDCSGCVKTAFQSVKDECGKSISGQSYLQKCYISYNYYPNGISGIPASSGRNKHIQRTVAIALGGVAAIAFLVVCLMCIRSVMKKKRVSKYDGY